MYHLRGAAFWHHSSPTTLPFVRLRLLSSAIKWPKNGEYIPVSDAPNPGFVWERHDFQFWGSGFAPSGEHIGGHTETRPAIWSSWRGLGPAYPFLIWTSLLSLRERNSTQFARWVYHLARFRESRFAEDSHNGFHRLAIRHRRVEYAPKWWFFDWENDDSR